MELCLLVSEGFATPLGGGCSLESLGYAAPPPHKFWAVEKREGEKTGDERRHGPHEEAHLGSDPA